MPDNPWLAIPLEDYESHMALPEIGQARILAEELAKAASQTAARSVALVGCSGGNGLATLPATVRRVVAIDINPSYVKTVRGRFGGGSAALELFVADIQEGAPPCPPVDLVYAGLIFEYVDVAATMTALRGLCVPAGVMVAVIQLPSDSGRFVSPSPFSSLQALQGRARLRSRQELEEHARGVGFHPTDARKVTSAGGKSFDVLSFRG
jgi:SAM-dependent methyltransferase